MRKKCAHIVIILLLLLSYQKNYALHVYIPQTTTNKIDTNNYIINKPNSEKEQKIFSEKALNYQEEIKKDEAQGESWWTRFWRWLFNRKSVSQNITEKTTSAGRGFMDALWIILIIAALVGLIYLMFRKDFGGIFRGKPKDIKANFSDITEKIEDLKPEDLIEKAIREGNYKLATRWWFLKLLQKLALQEKIVWEPSKTNLDYYFELKGGQLKEAFANTSLVYEYVWYGDFPIDKQVFENSVKHFKKFEELVK